jgi:hypothetical protein
MALERQINVDHLSIDGTEITSTAVELNILDTVTATAAELNYLDIASLGTGAASKAIVLSAASNWTSPAAGTVTMSSGSTFNLVGTFQIGSTSVLATAAELNRTCDVSTRKVSLTATASITEVLHEGKVCVITGTAAATYTLPEATGSGATYRFIMNEVNTNGTIITTADATNCSFFGSINILDKDAAAQGAYAPAATDEKITLNGTTSGGQIGDYIEVIDMATDKWCVFGQLQVPTGSNPATPFSGA